jgi:hypothetical protein
VPEGLTGPLTPAEIESFVELGHVLLRGAFPRAVADAARAKVWERLAEDPSDPSTWTRRFVHVQENLDGPPFSTTWTDRVHAAFDQLLGDGRWKRRTKQGWWPVVFPGFDEGPWRAPEAGWHVDGQQFHHHLDSPDQALLPIFLFSDIGPGDGGTGIAEGSHVDTARVLADAEPLGLSAAELADRVAALPRRPVVETNGEAGDVALLHPFILHASTPNTGTSVRFITNPCIEAHEPFRLDDPASPVERAIAAAVSG